MQTDPTTEEGLWQRAYGAVLGALVGDASGAVLEFRREPITPLDVVEAMRLPGGGIWNVAPGQVTDDGELTMSLLQGLVEEPDQPTNAAARRYARWVASDPFDIGATTKAALGCLRDPELARRAEREGVGAVMTQTAAVRCMASKANGSLMRSTPLAVWGARPRVTDAELAGAVAADARLSHPNDACVGAAIAYVLAIRHLVLNPGDVAGAWECAVRGAASFEEPRTWLDEARAGVIIPYTPMDGFVRIGFTHAFRHLLLGSTYVDALHETLLGGGDSDTNACIVGGLLGARWGVDGIPKVMRTGVVEASIERAVHRRPAELHPHHASRLVSALLARG